MDDVMEEAHRPEGGEEAMSLPAKSYWLRRALNALSRLRFIKPTILGGPRHRIDVLYSWWVKQSWGEEDRRESGDIMDKVRRDRRLLITNEGPPKVLKMTLDHKAYHVYFDEDKNAVMGPNPDCPYCNEGWEEV